jgi:hypothetical protein
MALSVVVMALRVVAMALRVVECRVKALHCLPFLRVGLFERSCVLWLRLGGPTLSTLWECPGVLRTISTDLLLSVRRFGLLVETLA